jgi:hypothetical protein
MGAYINNICTGVGPDSIVFFCDQIRSRGRRRRESKDNRSGSKGRGETRVWTDRRHYRGNARIEASVYSVIVIVKETTFGLKLWDMRYVCMLSQSTGEEVARDKGSRSWLVRRHQRRDERTGGGRRLGSGLRD